MTTLEKLEVLTNAINSTEGLSGEEFNKNENALIAYKVLFGEQQLKQTLSEKQDLHLNRFYNPGWLFERLFKDNDIDTVKTKALLDKIKNRYTRNWLLIDLIKNAIKKNEIEMAENMIAELPDEDSGPARYLGHRVMLEYYAQTCNIEQFKSRLKASKPGKFPKNEIGRYKYLLVETFAKEHGFSKGLKLCKDKSIGEQFSMAAIKWTAHLLKLDKIDLILEGNPTLLQIAPNAKAELYVSHFKNQKPVAISDENFSKVIQEVMKVDKDIKHGDGRLRDFLLWDLGSATTNRIQILECKKLIISPFYKKELNYYLKSLGG